jgi:MFS family permease
MMIDIDYVPLISSISLGTVGLFYVLWVMGDRTPLLPTPDPLPAKKQEISTIFSPYRSLIFAGVGGLLFWSSFDSLLPTLPKYIEDLGATRWQVGMVMCCFTIGLFGLRPQMGYLADLRSRKLVLMMGVSIVTVTPLLYILVNSIGFLMAIRAFHGIAIAAFTTAYSALVVTQSPPEKRGQMIGYLSMVRPLGMSIGPALGTWIQGEMGNQALFIFAGGLGLLAMACVSQVDEPEKTPTGYPKLVDKSSHESSQFWQLVVSPRLRISTLVFFLGGLVFGTLSIFVALFMRETGISTNAGWFFTAAGVANIAVRVLSSRVSDRYGRGIMITFGLVGYGVSVFMLSLAHNPSSFLVAGFLEGAGAGAWIPAMIALVADRSGTHERGRVYSVCLGGLDLGTAISGPVMGVVADIWSYQVIFSLTAIVALVALAIFITQGNNGLIRSLKFALGQEPDFYALETGDSYPLAAKTSR